MKLKCIGGPSDGKIVEVTDYDQTVLVPDPYKHVLFPTPDDMISPQPFSSTIYTRRTLRVTQELQELIYLAPYGVSDLNSLRHLLEP